MLPLTTAYGSSYTIPGGNKFLEIDDGTGNIGIGVDISGVVQTGVTLWEKITQLKRTYVLNDCSIAER